jgi:hypothetical protein
MKSQAQRWWAQSTLRDVAADFAPLYPPYTWIAAPAGMTKEVQRDAAGVWGVPRSSVLPPKSGGQGVEKRQLGVFQNANDHTSREEERTIRRRNGN